MPRFDPQLHHRRSIRLPQYDYAQPGTYFVTVCTKQRTSVFGEVVEGEMRLTAAGQIVQTIWNDIPYYYSTVDIDAFVVMPNLIRGIIVLTVGVGPRACPALGRPQGVSPTMSLPMVVHRFKSLTTTRYRQIHTQPGGKPFARSLWQPYERDPWNRGRCNSIVSEKNRCIREIRMMMKYLHGIGPLAEKLL